MVEQVKWVTQNDMDRECCFFSEGIVVSKKNKIILQYVPHGFSSSKDKIGGFGNFMDIGDNPLNIIRQEILGNDLNILPENITGLGAIQNKDNSGFLVKYFYLIHDRTGEIEAKLNTKKEIVWFESLSHVQSETKVNEDVLLALNSSKKRRIF